MGVGRTSTPAEIRDTIRKVFSDMGSLSLKQEAANLKIGGSSLLLIQK